MRLLAVCVYALVLSACVWLQHGTSETEIPVETTESAEIVEANLVAGQGEICAGIAAIQCSDGAFCKMEPGACMEIADAAGTCAEASPMCTREYKPVCGCDGKTYPNACQAYASSTSVASDGACAAG